MTTIDDGKPVRQFQLPLIVVETMQLRYNLNGDGTCSVGSKDERASTTPELGGDMDWYFY